MQENRWQKIGQVLMAAVLLAVLWGGLLGHLLLPDGEISREERRKLAQAPAWSWAALADGSFSRQFEQYAQDQFPLRGQLRTAKALTQYGALGRRDNNGLYLAQGQLGKLEYPLREGEVAKASDKFREVAERYFAGCHWYYAVVPDKNYYLAEENGYPALDYGRLRQLLREGLNETFCEIPLDDLLSAESYYATDTHWAQERILPVAQRIAAAMGAEGRIGWQQFQTLSAGDFYGAYYAQAALPVQPDTLLYLQSEALEQMEVWYLEGDRRGGVYDLQAPEQSPDAYDLYLSGAEALVEIYNPAGEGQLILLRDSFGSSLVPLLAEGYGRVSIVDLRYLSTEALGQFLEVQPGADVLFLYSTLSLNHASMLK